MADGEMIDSEAIDSSSIELFWGQELSSKTKTYEYTGESDADEGIETTIEFRGACLGIDAKDERNIVNLTTEDIDGNEVTHTILSMRLDRNEQVPIYLSVKPPMKLELVQGSGPVSIVGNMMSVLGDISGDEMEDDDDDEEEKQPLKRLVKAEYDDDNGKDKQALKKLGKSVLKSKDTQKKKRPADSPVEKPAKKNKRARPEEDDECDEEDSAMDASFEVPSLKQLKASLKDNDDEDEEDVDSDDDDDDNDGESDDEEESTTSDDDDDDDDLSDEDSEEESEEEEVKPPVKKGKGGKGSGSKATAGKNKPVKGLSQTPVPKTQTKLKQQQAPSSVPKNTKKTSGKTPDIDQIKKRLLTSPSLPKKLDRFNNLLKANYKIHDDNTRKELWEFVQKTKK